MACGVGRVLLACGRYGGIQVHYCVPLAITVCCCTALQNSTGQSVTYLTGGIIATRAMQDAVKLIIKGLAYQERAGCRVPAMNIGTG